MSYGPRPGERHTVDAASRQRNHGDPAIEDSYVGIIQKQVQRAGDQGLANQAVIDHLEPCVLVITGIVEVPLVTSSVRGSTVWINGTNDVLTLTDPGGGNGHKFGRVEDIPGQRDCPVGVMRVNLNAKDSF